MCIPVTITHRNNNNNNIISTSELRFIRTRFFLSFFLLLRREGKLINNSAIKYVYVCIRIIVIFEYIKPLNILIYCRAVAEERHDDHTAGHIDYTLRISSYRSSIGSSSGSSRIFYRYRWIRKFRRFRFLSSLYYRHVLPIITLVISHETFFFQMTNRNRTLCANVTKKKKKSQRVYPYYIYSRYP